MTLDANDILKRVLAGDEFFVGGTGGPLTLRLKTADGLTVAHWLWLDAATNRLTAMPLEAHVGLQEYNLEATDADGQTAACPFNVQVKSRPASARHPAAAYEASAKFDIDYDEFVDNATLRLDVTTRLAAAFGDADARMLAITRVERGSVELSWTNTSVVSDGAGECPASQVAEINARMFADDGSIRESFRAALRPYEMLGASMAPRGTCATAVGEPSEAPAVAASMSSAQPPTAATGDVEPRPAKAAADPMTVIIIPTLIVVAAVIVAIIIACVLWRRRRQTKKKNSAASPDKNVKHGAPVIFAYELDDAASTTPSKPLTGAGTVGAGAGGGLNNGDRTPAPPNYQAATTATTPPMADQRRPLLAGDTEQMSPLRYQPPPGSAVRTQTGPGGRPVYKA